MIAGSSFIRSSVVRVGRAEPAHDVGAYALRPGDDCSTTLSTTGPFGPGCAANVMPGIAKLLIFSGAGNGRAHTPCGYSSVPPNRHRLAVAHDLELLDLVGGQRDRD